MRDYLLNLLEQSKALTLDELLTQTIMAVVIGIVIYISYWISHAGTIYSRKFNASLVMLTILTETVMCVIGNNVALSLGMVGALSIVRFRTAIKDSRDTAYIFWAIVGGICCGSGEYMIGAVGSCAVFLMLLILGWVKNDNRVLMVIRVAREKESDIEMLVFQSFNNKARLRVKNTTENSVEFIYELSKKRYDKTVKNSQRLIDQMYSIENVEYVNIVMQNDEII